MISTGTWHSSDESLNEIIEYVRNQGQQLLKRNNLIEVLNTEVARRTTDNNELWHNYQFLFNEHEMLKDNYRRIKEQCDQIARKIADNPKYVHDCELIVEKLIALKNEISTENAPPPIMQPPIDDTAGIISSKAAKRKRKAVNKLLKSVEGETASQDNLDIYKPPGMRGNPSAEPLPKPVINAVPAMPPTTVTVEKSPSTSNLEIELTQKANLLKKEVVRLNSMVENLKTTNADLKQQNRLLRDALKVGEEREDQALNPELKEEISKILNLKTMATPTQQISTQPFSNNNATTTEDGEIVENVVSHSSTPSVAAVATMSPGFLTSVNTVFQRQGAQITALLARIDRLKNRVPEVPKRRNSSTNTTGGVVCDVVKNSGTAQSTATAVVSAQQVVHPVVREIIVEEDGEVFSSYKRLKGEVDKGKCVVDEDE